MCAGETVGKMGEVDEMSDNLCLWPVSSAARNETRHVDDNCFRDTEDVQS